MLFGAFRGFVYKRYSDTFFSKKGKDKLYDKSTHGASCTMAVVCLSGESESRRRCHRRVRMLYVQRL